MVQNASKLRIWPKLEGGCSQTFSIQNVIRFGGNFKSGEVKRNTRQFFIFSLLKIRIDLEGKHAVQLFPSTFYTFAQVGVDLWYREKYLFNVISFPIYGFGNYSHSMMLLLPCFTIENLCHIFISSQNIYFFLCLQTVFLKISNAFTEQMHLY